jgi:elongation factor P
VKQARAAAFIRAKIRNLETNNVQERRFNVDDHFPDVGLLRREMQFLYDEGKIYHFMDAESFEQIAVDERMVADAMTYNTEGVLFTFTYADGKLIAVAPPTFVVMVVADSPPSVAGDTARSALNQSPDVCKQRRQSQGRHPHRRLRREGMITSPLSTQCELLRKHQRLATRYKETSY